MKSIILFFLAFSISANLLAQNEEVKELANFNKIQHKGGLNYEITLRKADASKIEIWSDEYDVKKIDISAENGTLRIEDEENKLKSMSKNDRLKIYATIYYTELSEISSRGVLNLSHEGTLKSDKLQIDLSGAGKMDLNLDVEKLLVSMSGASNLTFTGKAAYQEMEVSGAGNIRAENLEGKEGEIRVSGVGNVKVNISESLEAQVSGVGNIRYKGNPERLISKANGIGNIKKD